MKNDNKIVIMALADTYVNIQKTKCDPLLDIMADNLKSLYPKMEDQAMDWALEFINRESKDHTDTFKRLDVLFL